LEDIGVEDYPNVSIDLKEIGYEDVDWIRQDMYQWQAFVDTVMNVGEFVY
jgi:hypothetical protein